MDNNHKKYKKIKLSEKKLEKNLWDLSKIKQTNANKLPIIKIILLFCD